MYYGVSDRWIKAQDHFLAPEGLIELACYVPELKETLIYTKRDLLSFTHHQTGSLVSGELPKNYIQFSLDNSDGRWNPHNPAGLERYLSERLRITLRYGFVVDGVNTWIPGGVFYLSEWRTSLNGLEATFTARDMLEYMIDKPYTGSLTGTLLDVVDAAIEESGIETEIVPGSSVLGEAVLGSAVLGEAHNALVRLSVDLDKPIAIESKGDETIAVILQKCANAAGCVMYQDRGGTLMIHKLYYEPTGYTIPRKFSYAYPEIEFSRPIKNVSVAYHGGQSVVRPFGSSGETQTVTNDFIMTEEQANEIALWVSDSLRTRKKISGEFRGDLRLDLFDVVDVETRYGTVAGVVLTDIKYSFTGAFRASYSGYVRGSGEAVTMYCGEVITGEVI